METSSGKTASLDLLGTLLEYPQQDFFKNLSKIEIDDEKNEVKDVLNTFKDKVSRKSIDELQELYTAAFDFAASSDASLYSGVHIFGEENYNRGNFMAQLKEAQVSHSIDNKQELPDFIPNVLRLAERLTSIKEKTELLKKCVVEPMNTVAKAFEDSSNPYKFAIVLVKKITENSLEILEMPGKEFQDA